MSGDLIALLFWLLGWLFLSIGYYVNKVAIDKDHRVTKKVHAWRAFWNGVWSWIGIIFIFAFLLVEGIEIFNDWVENKLNNE